ncbi:hypothetical protein DFQ09_1262 [Winogradskyella pacifica]|uniref:Uncharacterized protein n=1 Tax=Winogradskyella pacifica TaxID=664642 RepID=A0A3D9LK50_9FLAO|nr:hypothetical protein [Winogradskyella pacifica]REE06934.1 hypothetical protein DFQ09_1262 [Winogradskyella pacifica]
MHPIKAYNYTVAPPVLINIAPVFSSGDIVAFLGMGEFTGFSNDNITAILISPAGGFAMRIDDEDKMQAALQLLEPIGYDDYGNPIDSPDMKKLKDDYNKQVIEPCGDTDNTCFKEKFKDFINNFTLSNGDGLGISYYEATFDANDNRLGTTIT